MKRPMPKLKKGQIKVYLTDYGDGHIYLNKTGHKYIWPEVTIMSKKRYDRIKGVMKVYNRVMRELRYIDTWYGE